MPIRPAIPQTPPTPGPMSTLLQSVSDAARIDDPFRHWTLRNLLPRAVCDAVRAWPAEPAPGGPPDGPRDGQRASRNTTRIFLDPARQRRHPAAAVIAACFQHERAVAALETLCGTRLSGAFLRIECCLDTDGFWLEPHTDIGAKLLTLVLYLSDDPGCEAWGTDILHADGSFARRVPAIANTGLLFVPAHDTWHGFAPRPITGIRRSLIVNYVAPSWRSRHELAFVEPV